MKPRHHVALAALFTTLIAGPAPAAIIGVHSAAELEPDDVVLWSQFGPAGTFVDTPSDWTSEGGLPGHISSAAPSLTVRQQGVDWFGDFPAGEFLIHQPNSESSLDTSEQIFIRFDSPVFGLGAEFQPVVDATFTITIEAYDVTSTLIDSFTSTSLDGNLQFFGVLSDTANISFIRLLNNTTGTFNDGFAFGRLQLALNAVPEPAAFGLLGLGLAAVSLRRRK